MRSIIRSYIANHPFGAGVAATIAILLGGTSLAAAAKHVGPFINGTVSYVATTAGPVIFGDNQGSGIGVEGVTDTGAAAGAIALQGFGTSSSQPSVGVNGATLGPGSTALIGNANAVSGAASVGLEGFAANGEGVFAQSTNAGFVSLRSVDANAFYDVRLSDSVTGNGMTSLLNTSSSGAAVAGEDTVSSSSFNLGVLGTSASGDFGVEGLIGGNGFAGVYGQDNTSTNNQIGVEGFSANGRGVFGNSTSGQGTDGNSTNAQGAFGNSTFGNGVWGQSTNNDGTDGFTSNPSLTQSPRSGGFFLDNSSDGGGGDFGVTGASTNGVGVQGATTSGSYGGFFTSGINGVSGTGGNFGTVGICSGAASGEFAGSPDGSSVNFTVNCSGTPSAILQGHHHLYADTTFAQTTEPVIEDFGNGQLVNGVANVRLEASFADAITDRAAYMVFITPDGDSRGLYVTQKTMQGFVVRESGGGTSNIAFDYRIVSRPAAATQPRMYAISGRPSLLPRGMVAPSAANAARMIAEHIAAFRAVNAAIRANAARNTKAPRAPHLASRWPIFEPRMINGKLHGLPFKPTVIHSTTTKPQT